MRAPASGGKAECHHADAGRPGLDRLVDHDLALAAVERTGERDPAQKLEGASAGSGEFGTLIAAKRFAIALRHRSHEPMVEIGIDNAVVAFAWIMREPAGRDQPDAAL